MGYPTAISLARPASIGSPCVASAAEGARADQVLGAAAWRHPMMTRARAGWRYHGVSLEKPMAGGFYRDRN